MKATCMLVFILLAMPAGFADDIRSVEVTAEGYDKDDALRQALRKALEKGAGTQIASYSKVEDFELVRDTIYTRAHGIVTEYDILKHAEGSGGVWVCKLRAKVRRDAVAKAWGEVMNVLEQVGHPKIMVMFREEIDGQPQSSSMVESRVSEMLTKAGFHIVSWRGFEDIKRREAEAALATSDDRKLARIAKEAGAQIYIRGFARADWNGLRDIYGVSAACYGCTITAEAYYTDTATSLLHESIPNVESCVRSARHDSPQAAASALAKATFPSQQRYRENKLATKIHDAMLEKWCAQITTGNELQLTVENCRFKTYRQLKRALEDLKGIESVEGSFEDRVATFRIKAKVSAETLAERLVDPPFENWLEIQTLKLNSIKAYSGN